MEPYNGQGKYIFISYPHADNKRVFPIIDRLMKEGFNVWYDKGIEIGNEWPAEIAYKLKNAEVVICMMSKLFLDSSNCRNELNMACSYNKNMFCIFMEETAFVTKQELGVELQINSKQNIMKYQYAGQEEQFFERLMSVTALQPCRDRSKGNSSVAIPDNAKDAKSYSEAKAFADMTNEEQLAQLDRRAKALLEKPAGAPEVPGDGLKSKQEQLGRHIAELQEEVTEVTQKAAEEIKPNPRYKKGPDGRKLPLSPGFMLPGLAAVILMTVRAATPLAKAGFVGSGFYTVLLAILSVVAIVFGLATVGLVPDQHRRGPASEIAVNAWPVTAILLNLVASYRDHTVIQILSAIITGLYIFFNYMTYYDKNRAFVGPLLVLVMLAVLLTVHTPIARALIITLALSMALLSFIDLMLELGTDSKAKPFLAITTVLGAVIFFMSIFAFDTLESLLYLAD